MNLNSDFTDIFKKCSIFKEKEKAIIEENKKDLISTLEIMKQYNLILTVIFIYNHL